MGECTFARWMELLFQNNYCGGGGLMMHDLPTVSTDSPFDGTNEATVYSQFFGKKGDDE